MKVTGKGLSAGSIFKLSFIGFAGFWIVCYVVTIINGFIFSGSPDAPGIKINGVAATSPENWWALLIALPFATVICGGLIGLALVVGQWAYTRFRPLTLEFHSASKAE